LVARPAWRPEGVTSRLVTRQRSVRILPSPPIPQSSDPVARRKRTDSPAEASAALTDRRLAQFAAIVERSADAFVAVDLQGHITDWNAAAERLFGYTAAEIIGCNVEVLAPADRTSEIADTLSRLRAGTPVVPRETIRRRKDGVRIPVSITVSPLLGAGGEVTGAAGIYRDITEHRRAQAALLQSEASYRTLVEHATYGIYRSSVAGRFLAVNPALVQMLGYDTADELLALDLKRDLYVDITERERMIALHGGKDVMPGADLTWRRRDGTAIMVHVSGRTVHDADGSVAYFEMIVENVTERRELEAQLRRAQKMEALGQLTGGIAHDFNNLLTVVQSTADLLDGALPADRADLHDDIESLRATARRGAALVKRLQAFGRRDMLALANVDLLANVNDLVPTLRRLLPEHIDIHVQAAEGLPAVRADPVSVEQIVISLATNARDAMPEGGVVRIELQRVDLDEAHRAVHGFGAAGRYICLAMSDTGVGMDERTKARVFDPFFTTKAPGSGTGLGLATVYSLMQQHDGFVHIYSEVGQGTTVRVYFPVARTTPARGGVAAATELRGGKETILVVEDEPPIRRAAQRVLEKFGYNVLVAADGQEALDLLGREGSHVDLVLTDVVMPRLGGRALFDKVREAGGKQKFLFASGYTARDVHESAHLSPDMAFLSKPWTLTDLVGRVRDVLDSKPPA
jgi:PAS domain S-box-containing protein